MPEFEAWSVLPFTEETAADQLAQTDRLWQSVAAGHRRATIRWYGYTRRAVVLGVGQPPAAVDAHVARDAGLDIVKRNSGGTAVLVEPGSPALDVALPVGHPLAGKDIVEAYRWLGEVFLAALTQLAPAAPDKLSLITVAEARADQRATREVEPASPAALRVLSCFGTLSPYEVALSNGPIARKLVGFSQLRKRGVVLYQAGLYVSVPNAALVDALSLDPAARPPLIQELETRTAGLDALGLDGTQLPALMEAVNQEAARRLERALLARRLSAELPARSVG